MLNVLIADDEIFIRKRLIKVIEWKELNLNFLGEAEDGIGVLDMISKNKIDLILLDIKMPHLNGIDVCKHIYENYPTTKIIILSGYNDFEYARATIKYGILEYLLKPISSDALNKTLKECSEKIKKEKKSYQQIQRYYHYEKCNHLYDIRVGKLPINTIYDKYPELYNTNSCIFLSVFINENMTLYIDKFIDLFRSQKIDCEYFKETDYIYTIQIFLCKNVLFSTIKNLLETFLNTSSINIFIGLSNPFDLEDDWNKHYKITSKILRQRYFINSNKSIIYNFLNNQEQQNIDVSKVRQSIIKYINTKDIEGFKYYIHTLLEDIFNKKNISYMNTIITEIFLTYKIYYDEFVKYDKTTLDFINTLLDEDYKISYIEETILSYGLKCLKKETIPSDIVFSKKIIEYIEKNYNNADLSVAKIAEVFNLNTSYIGTLFKKVNNQSILNYITVIRMEKSKKLLRQNKYKIGEISEMVGYGDVFYYSKCFKKMYGYSPKDFVQNINLD